MALTATTLTGAVAAQDTSIVLGSVTHVSAPVSTTGAGYTYLLCENEWMFVSGAPNTTTLQVPVLRGVRGSQAVAHAASAPVVAGTPDEWGQTAPHIGAFDATNPYQSGWSAPLAGGATNIAPGGKFHLTGTTAMVNLTAPAGYVEGGVIRIVFDGSGSGLTWTAAGNIAVAGTATTAASYVDFVYDSGSAKWHPSRLA